MLRDLICHVRNGDFALPRTHIMKSVKISKLVKIKYEATTGNTFAVRRLGFAEMLFFFLL